MRSIARFVLLAAALASLALLVASCEAASGSGGGSDSDADGDTDSDTDTDADTDTDSDSDTDTDTGQDTDTDDCFVDTDELTGEPQECSEFSPPDSFEPDVQWTWSGPGEDKSSLVTPLVANLTDDNDDDSIDLCDIPDIVVVVTPHIGNVDAHIYVLDGETGAEHFMIETGVSHHITPALGDIDGDGLPEIVTGTGSTLVAFEHDGSLKWFGDAWSPYYTTGAVALADLDNDGDVEILAENHVYDHEGVLEWTASEPAGPWSATTAADLDGDGDLELVLGHAAFHHDGGVYYVSTEVEPGFPQVADFDDDPEPEILITNYDGLSMLEHDGTTKYANLRPTGVAASGNNWPRPATVHDFDGDGQAEFAMSSAQWYTVYEGDASIVWSEEVADFSGVAAGTAFDFLGDGTAEAMYADEQTLFIYDELGNVLLETLRDSQTLVEYPVVADVDDDGSAEIVIVSQNDLGETSPTVKVIRDIEDRWIQARRIWNQHAYHVTNVYEDGTIPQHEPPSWEHLNTFRTNSQIENGVICDPVIE